MEFASRLRWFIFIALAALLIILIGWGLFSIANTLFRGGTDDSSQSALVDESLDYDVAITGTAKLTVDGPVVANGDHRSYVIEVSENVVNMKVYSSYGQTILAEKSYQNTEDAYDTFLSALDKQKVTSRIKKTTTENDFEDVGVCPKGKRYIVELDSEVRRWGVSCSTKEGTAGFSMGTVRVLFQKQIPDYRDLVKGLGL